MKKKMCESTEGRISKNSAGSGRAKCHHCRKQMSLPLENKHSWHEGNPHVAGVSDKIKKVWGKASGLHLGFLKGIVPSPQNATGMALPVLHGCGFLFQRNS